jgi:predicted Zn-ribbon and HTH transcriptional regulator
VIQVLPSEHCRKCGHAWVKRIPGRPVECPKCKSRTWDMPKGESVNAK